MVVAIQFMVTVEQIIALNSSIHQTTIMHMEEAEQTLLRLV